MTTHFGPRRAVLLAVLFLILSCVEARAAFVESVASVRPGVTAGRIADVDLFVTNPTDGALSTRIPRTLKGELRFGQTVHSVKLALAGGIVAGERTLAPGGFVKVRYEMAVPAGVSGQAVLDPGGLGAHPVVLAVGGSVSEAAAPAVEPGMEAVPVQESWSDPEPVAEARHNPGGDAPLNAVTRNFFTHEPMYFLWGPDPSEAKFQFSFKYRFLNPEGSWATRNPWLARLYMGYTQTSFWDWEGDSKPFKDSAYKPELFYYDEAVDMELPSWLQRLGIAAGFQHESNGQGGDRSRSLNIVYVRPTFQFPDIGDWYFLASPKIWTYVGDMSDNPDMHRYRGYMDLRLQAGQEDGLALSTNLRKGTAWDKGSIQVDATYPLWRKLDENLNLYLHAQFFTGYGESLIRYDQRDTRWRIGFALVR